MVSPVKIMFVLALLLCVANVEYPHEANADESRFAADDWPWWRGPNHNGIAHPHQTPPLEWNLEDGVVWKAGVPGRGHGAAIVVGNDVLLATAEVGRDVQGVLCLNRVTGERKWHSEVHVGAVEKEAGNQKASQASSTVACDGERLFISFLNAGAVYTTALDRSGKILWQTKITDYLIHQGYGASPLIHKALVIVSADNKGPDGGALAGLRRDTGEIVWRHRRPSTPNYTSPVVLEAAGREQLFVTGCDLVSGYDPLSGEKLWEIAGATTECVTSTVTDGERIFTSGGYPKNHVSAVKADGSGELVWENNVRVYVPSMLARDGLLYGVTDAGVAMCWESATGEEVWKGRLGGTFSASPVLVGARLFAVNEAGEVFVFSAAGDDFKLLHKSELGCEVFATPTICGSRVYLRGAHQRDGQREEVLYCLGER